MSDNKLRAVMYCRVGNKEQLSEATPEFVGHGLEFNGDSMYELLSMHKGYDVFFKCLLIGSLDRRSIECYRSVF